MSVARYYLDFNNSIPRAFRKKIYLLVLKVFFDSLTKLHFFFNILFFLLLHMKVSYIVIY